MKEEFAELIAQHQDIIHKVCRLYCHNREDKQDLFQDIVYQLWKSYPTFKGESKFTTWMYRVALNTAITDYRKFKKRGKSSEFTDNLYQLANQNDNEIFNERVEMLYAAINRLSDIEKALVMLLLEDNSYQDIAHIMGITLTNVGVKINRVKKKLKDILTKQALWN